jgi:hypothetical protein
MVGSYPALLMSTDVKRQGHGDCVEKVCGTPPPMLLKTVRSINSRFEDLHKKIVLIAFNIYNL